MSENNFFIEYKKLLSHFFFHMHTSREINASNTNLSDLSIKLYSGLKKTDENWSCTLNPSWIIPITKNKYFIENYAAYLVIGGEIEVDNNNFKKFNFYISIIRRSKSSDPNNSKYLSCCERDHYNEPRVVRRFHFDTGAGIPELLETKSHLQFGGICHEKLAVYEYERKDIHYCLDNKLYIPRLPYPPLDIITLLDIILRQFNTSIDHAFERKKEWIKLVSRSEDFRLKKYYNQINNYFKQKEVGTRKVNPKTLFQNLCEEDCVF